ncbi:MAG: hypothetical protein ABMA13_09090 [Chthoniobacteraceae bacterium]
MSIDDPSLVIPEPVPQPFRWLSLTLATGMISLTAYLAASNGVRDFPVGPGLTTDDTIRQKVNHYALGERPRLAVLGSSLADRLPERFFTLTPTRNLALPGGSPLTGMMLVESLASTPGTIVVEINVLDRKPRPELIERYRSPALVRLREFKPLRTAVNALLPLNANDARKLRAKPPHDYDTATLIRHSLVALDRRAFEAPTREHATEIARIADVLEARGSRVFFVQLPMDPALEQSRYFTRTKQIMQDAAARPDRWLDLRVERGQLRWIDGAHLDERSALLVIEAIEQAVQH